MILTGQVGTFIDYWMAIPFSRLYNKSEVWEFQLNMWKTGKVGTNIEWLFHSVGYNKSEVWEFQFNKNNNWVILCQESAL